MEKRKGERKGERRGWGEEDEEKDEEDEGLMSWRRRMYSRPRIANRKAKTLQIFALRFLCPPKSRTTG